MNFLARRYWLCAIGFVLALCDFSSPPSHARVDISVDAKTLTDLLSTMVPPGASLSLVGDRKVTLQIDDLRITGFDPAAGKNGEGLVLSALRLKVPELGLNIPVEPRLSLHLEERDGRSVCHLLFEEVVVPLPLSGPVDIAPLLPRIPVPADNVTRFQSARGFFQVRTRLVEARMGSRALQFGFDLEVSPVEPPRP